MRRQGVQRPQFKGSPPSPVASFTPSSIAGLQLWLDASDASTITLDGSNNVEQWRDKSGNAEHAAQASATLRPGVTTVNGLAAVLFDGVDDQMGGTELLTSDSNFTLFAVVKKIAARLVADVAYFIIGTDKSFGLSIGISNIGGYLNGGVAWHDDLTVITNGTVLRQTLRRAAGTTYYTRSGGISVSFLDTPVAAPYGNYLLGKHSASAQQNLAICEILLYTSSLSTENQSLVNDYLNSRWGTT